MLEPRGRPFREHLVPVVVHGSAKVVDVPPGGADVLVEHLVRPYNSFGGSNKSNRATRDLAACAFYSQLKIRVITYRDEYADDIRNRAAVRVLANAS